VTKPWPQARVQKGPPAKQPVEQQSTAPAAAAVCTLTAPR
jgi:hypothetical protein